MALVGIMFKIFARKMFVELEDLARIRGMGSGRLAGYA
jgi:hypothetical protein